MALPPSTLDNTVVVTGASAGIGAELARQLAGRGYNLVLVARRAERLAALGEELRLTHGIHADVEPCDLVDADARDALVERLRGGERAVAGVCNNAGFGSVATLVESDLEHERKIVRLNVEALHHLTGVFLGDMVERGAGAILNVASTAAFQPLPGFATYAASKAFVQSFSEAVHTELAGTGVSVTCLFPGFTHTEFLENPGTEGAESTIPGFLWMEAPEVARVGIDAMAEGRRSAIPGMKNRAFMLSGRMTPRSLLLPLLREVTRRR